jgi:hypothetical protein
VAVAVPEAAARQPASAGAATQEAGPAAQDVASAEFLVTVVAEEDGRPLPDVPWVSAAGYTSKSVGLGGAHASLEQAHRIALERVAGLHGSVTDGSGAPQVGVSVSATAQEAGVGFANGGREGLAELTFASTTDPQGRYVLADLPANVGLSFQVRAGERLLLDEGTPLRLAPGKSRVHDLLVDVAGGIRGVVFDAAGAPIRHQALWLAGGQRSARVQLVRGSGRSARHVVDRAQGARGAAARPSAVHRAGRRAIPRWRASRSTSNGPGSGRPTPARRAPSASARRAR